MVPIAFKWGLILCVLTGDLMRLHQDQTKHLSWPVGCTPPRPTIHLKCNKLGGHFTHLKRFTPGTPMDSPDKALGHRNEVHGLKAYIPPLYAVYGALPIG